MELIQPLVKAYPGSYTYRFIFGLALYKMKAFNRAYEVLSEAWNARPYYDHEHYTLLKELEKMQQG